MLGTIALCYSLVPVFLFSYLCIVNIGTTDHDINMYNKKVKRKKHKEKQFSYLFSLYFCNYKNE